MSDLSDLSDFSDFHDELQAVARDQLGSSGGGAEVAWPTVVASGWAGLEVPADLDGAGATFAEVAIVLEEMGRAATAGPYLGAVVLGVGALAMVEPTPGRDELLGRIASGRAVPAVALAGDDGEGTGEGGGPAFRVERTSSGLLVHGRAAFVPDAAEADRLLLPARDDDGRGVVVSVGPDVTGLVIEALPVLDGTRRFASVAADGVEVEESQVWPMADGPDASLSRLSDRAAVAVACDCLGLSEAMLEATAAYATQREQFGRPIGSFQAVKHACADLAVQIAVTRALVSEAVRQVATPAPGADVGAAASMAKAYAGDTAVAVAGKAMQLHGGIGYTWESEVHVYLKRATLNRSLYGSPAVHRRRLGAVYAAGI